MVTHTDASGREIAVGMTLEPLSWDTGFATWNRFAAVNDEFVPIHMDDEAGRAAGMSGAFGMGNLQTSYLHVLIREWAGPGARITRFSIQWRKPNTKGTVTAEGTVTAVGTGRAGGTSVDIEARVLDAAGKVLAPATATVEFS